MRMNGAVPALYPPFYKPQDGAPDVVPEGEIDYPFEDVTSGGDENKIRGNWSAKVDFLLSCIGYTVGIANIWRFPYYCYKNGGGAFLVPYLILLIFAGMPIFFMELSIGQFASLGCISVWKVCPLFKGIGIAMFLLSFIVAIYYTIVIAWAIFYLTHSVREVLPWASCGHEWNTDNCFVTDRESAENCTAFRGLLLRNGSCVTEVQVGAELYANLSVHVPNMTTRTLPSEEYFHRVVLEITEGIEDVGSIRWQLALCLLLAWALVFVCLFKSIKSSGKVVYISAVAPYIILTVLLVRALTLKGSVDGIMHIFVFPWRKVLDVHVWGDAAVQVFFSLCSCWGGLTTLASYNKFHTDIFKSMWVIGLCDFLSSVYAAIVTYAIIGTMAYSANIEFYDAITKGPGLCFVVYTEALGRLPIAPLWAILFFIMIISLGLDTQFFVMETVVTSVCDEFPEKLRKNHRHVLWLFSVMFYACGVPLCTQAGMYMFNLIDYFALNWSLLIIGFFECMALSWVYGVDNFLDNIKWMLRYYPPPYIYWKIMWKFITPMILMAIMLFTWVAYEPLTYGGKPYPAWTNLVGWGVSFITVLAIPITAIIVFMMADGPCVERMRDLIIPCDEWGPALAVHRAEQYPLQVPEAREPMRHDLEGADDRFDDDDERFMLEKEFLEKLDNGVPSFDKETAI